MSRLSSRKLVSDQDSSGKRTHQQKTEGFISTRGNVALETTSQFRETPSFVNAMRALQDRIVHLEDENAELKTQLSSTVDQINELKVIIEEMREREQSFIKKIDLAEREKMYHKREIEVKQQSKIRELEGIIMRQENELSGYRTQPLTKREKTINVSVDEQALDQLLKEFHHSQKSFMQMSNNLITKYSSTPEKRQVSSRKVEQSTPYNKQKHVYDQLRVPSFSTVEPKANKSALNKSSLDQLNKQELFLDELSAQQAAIEQKIQSLLALGDNDIAMEMKQNLSEQLELIKQQKRVQLAKINQVKQKVF